MSDSILDKIKLQFNLSTGEPEMPGLHREALQVSERLKYLLAQMPLRSPGGLPDYSALEIFERQLVAIQSTIEFHAEWTTRGLDAGQPS